MNKKLFSLALFACLVVPSFTIASDVAIQESTLSVSAEANGEFEPDTAKIKFYVENSGLNLTELKAKNDKTVNAAIVEIKKKLNANESIKTIAFRVNSVYNYKDKVRVFQKYQVTNGFEVKLKDVNKASEIIQIAMNNGIKRVDNINFYIENSEKPCNELISEAARIAKNRATTVAAATGATISKVKTINPHCSLNSNYIQRRVYSTNAMLAKAADSAVSGESVESIEAGTISASASVNLTYYLK